MQSVAALPVWGHDPCLPLVGLARRRVREL
jgi:hypothetical protein